MGKDLIPRLKPFSTVAQLIHSYGWAEANAGNLSFRLKRRVFRQAGRRNLTKLDMAFPELAGDQILITGTGKRMRDLVGTPSRGVVLIEITKDGKGYYRLDGTANPSFELLMHLCVHQMCKKTKQDRFAVIHTHPSELIALTHVSSMQKENDFLKALFSTHPETTVWLKDAVKLLQYDLPGTPEIATATAGVLETAKIAVWAFHGAVSLAPDLETALDYIELANKAAEVYLKIKTLGQEPGKFTI